MQLAEAQSAARQRGRELSVVFFDPERASPGALLEGEFSFEERDDPVACDAVLLRAYGLRK